MRCMILVCFVKRRTAYERRISDWSSDVCSSDLLEAKAEAFVAELAALDANSPEFGMKVDQIANMGRREIAEAAGQSNRFLDRPVRAMDKDTGVGADLAEIGRASCRERVCQYVEFSVVAGQLKKKKITT